jgi:hypothetical protein
MKFHTGFSQKQTNLYTEIAKTVPLGILTYFIIFAHNLKKKTSILDFFNIERYNIGHGGRGNYRQTRGVVSSKNGDMRRVLLKVVVCAYFFGGERAYKSYGQCRSKKNGARECI